MKQEQRPYGAWRSPVSAAGVAGKSLRFGALQADGGALYWSESRPDEGGRGVVMRVRPGGAPEEILPAPYAARSRVHEYGGGEFLAFGGQVCFVEAGTQDIHVIGAGEIPRRLTHEEGTRFADMTYDARQSRLIAVAERHRTGQMPENFLAAIPLGEDGKSGLSKLAAGAGFYCSPRVSPDGGALAWLAWDLPHMPWERAALYVAGIGGQGTLARPRLIAGGRDSAVFQPEWGGDGKLYFVWDRSGWGRLHVWDGKTVTEVAAVTGAQTELMRPQWVFGMQSYALLDEARAVAAFIEQGETRLALIDLASGAITPVENDMRSVDALAPFGDGVAVIGATDTAAPAVVHLDFAGKAQILRSSGDAGLAGDGISKGEMLRFAGEDGDVYALFYPPANASCSAPGGERPPVIILVHGGPTGMAGRGLNLKIQYWTSRGFAVCDLDYSGSAGYGRAYRERLDGQWGLRDVADVGALARSLGESGRVDTNRVLISGGSAGGYTVLMALAALDIFAAGACAYAVADLAQLQRLTHKFESGYLYALTGANAQTCDVIFAQRSPITLAHEIGCPVIFFQGLEDKVVPPQQSRAMAQTLRQRGVPVAYSEFANEGHGFRRAETIIKVLESEYAFYARVLGLEPAEDLPGITIENWPE